MAVAALLAGTSLALAQNDKGTADPANAGKEAGTAEKAMNPPAGTTGPSEGSMKEPKMDQKMDRDAKEGSSGMKPNEKGDMKKGAANDVDEKSMGNKGDMKSEDKAGDMKSKDMKSGENKPDKSDMKSGDAKASDNKPNDMKAGENKAGDMKGEANRNPDAANKNAGDTSASSKKPDRAALEQAPPETKTKVRAAFTQNKIEPVRNLDISINVGVAIPRSVTVYTVPQEVVTIYPAYRYYRYFRTEDRIVIVDPDTLEIVEVIIVA